MSFAARYTSYSVTPLAHARGAAPPGYHVQLTVTVSLEHDVTGRNGQAVLDPLLTRALNDHAGGQRRIGTTQVSIEWRLSWSTRSPMGGQALGIAIMPDEIVDALARPDHPAGAITVVAEGATREFTRIIFRASMFARGAHAEQRQSTAAHELGHGFGLPDHRDDTRSTMFHRQLSAREYRRIDQRWTDAEVTRALQSIFSGPNRARPAWLPAA